MAVSVKRRRAGTSLYDYLASRGSTFAFVGFFMGGLALSSLCCVGSAESAALLRSIVSNDLTLQMGRSFPELLLAAVSGFAGIFIFIYLCLSSHKGAALIYAVPLIHGMAVGSLVTSVLILHGFTAINYILICIFLPKAVETLLLLSVCNKTSRYCKERFASQSPRKARGSGFPVLLYFVVFGLYFVLESMLIYLFRWLL